MKISYRTHPVLNKLKEKKLGLVGLQPQDAALLRDEKNKERLRIAFKNNVDAFNNNIQLITKPFFEAIEFAGDKLIADDLWNSMNDAGTILNFAGLNGAIMFYNTAPSISEPGTHDYTLFLFINETLVLFAQQDDNNKMYFVSKGYLSMVSSTHEHFNSFQNREDLMLEVVAATHTNLVGTLNFIKYANVTIKNLAPKSKVDEINCKYVNQTDSKIKILDSKWFTTLIKSDGFDVRGHLRLQPKKINGEWTKEMIWIKPFHKTGYTAPARKLKEYPEV